MPQQRKPCDQSWQDYQRHREHGEVACAGSKAEWRKHCAENRAKARKKGKS